MKTFSFTIHKRKENFVINLEWKLPRDGIREKVSRELRRPASAIKNIPLKLFTRYNRKRKFHFFNWLLFIPFLPSLSFCDGRASESHLNNIILANSNGDSPRRLWKKYKMKVLPAHSSSSSFSRDLCIEKGIFW